MIVEIKTFSEHGPHDAQDQDRLPMTVVFIPIHDLWAIQPHPMQLIFSSSVTLFEQILHRVCSAHDLIEFSPSIVSLPSALTEHTPKKFLVVSAVIWQDLQLYPSTFVLQL